MKCDITVKNRDIGKMHVSAITHIPMTGETLVSFRTEAGNLIATFHDSGLLTIFDPEYPNLPYGAERFRPLLEEAISVAHSENKTEPDG